jgi:hypothetical protein
MSNVKIARKKPIEIEVIQITDENIKEIWGFCGQFAFKRISPGIATSGTIGSNARDTASITNPVLTATLPPTTVYRINSSFAVNSDTAPFGIYFK